MDAYAWFILCWRWPEYCTGCKKIYRLVLLDWNLQMVWGQFMSVDSHELERAADYYGKAVSFLCCNHDWPKSKGNTAHEIKTPITAISLSVQTLQKDCAKKLLNQIQKQLIRFTHLEEALLILSRLDVGTLVLQKEKIDVFTVLVADNLQELLRSLVLL